MDIFTNWTLSLNFNGIPHNTKGLFYPSIAHGVKHKCLWGVSKSTFAILTVEKWSVHQAHGLKGMDLSLLINHRCVLGRDVHMIIEGQGLKLRKG